jgi:uncharacterized membrane protein YvbJ
VFCAVCGAKAPDEAGFCDSCGEPLIRPESDSGVAPPKVAEQRLGANTQPRDGLASAAALVAFFVLDNLTNKRIPPFSPLAISSVLSNMVGAIIICYFGVALYYRKKNPTPARSLAAASFWSLILLLLFRLTGH